MKRAPKMGPADRMARDAQRGMVTLVLGAGVSMPRGVPGWRDLAADLLFSTTGQRPCWLTSHQEDWDNLNEARALLRGKLPDAFVERLALDAGEPHPLALPMVFERVESELARTRDGNADEDVDSSFAGLLRSAMYENLKRTRRQDTLRVLAHLLRSEQQQKKPRIARVITFNADDLLEREVHGGLDAEEPPVVWVLARASHHPTPNGGAGGQPPIPVYHVHGFLPRDPEERQWADAPDTLVFTDAQYWSSVANPLSFANRVMANALHDSHCVFIGLSMTDLNITRWLGVRYNEILTDRQMQRQVVTRPGMGLEALQRRSLRRHYWVRTKDAAHDIVAEHLECRGVSSVVLPQWGTPFNRLMRDCFASS